MQRPVTLAALALLVPVLAAFSLTIGAQAVAPHEVLAALRGTGSAADIVLGLRLPRTILALLAGLGLGIAGAVMQSLTRNPLADPGLMGVNAGAGLAVVLAVAFAGISAPETLVWVALPGAVLAGGAVQIIGGANPVRLVLAGVALGAVMGGITSAITLADADLFRRTLGWGAGSLIVTDYAAIRASAPLMLAGAGLALALGPGLNALALGDDLAAATGARVGVIRALGLVSVTLGAGAATAAIGPIAFAGLIVPHLARRIAGPDQRWLIALSALIGPAVLLGADMLARVLLPTGEVPLGIVTAVLGAPLMIAVARRELVAA